MGQGGSPSYFIGTPYNIDDYCNYLSWLRQMADGRFFLHNLFTTDPQRNLQFNVFFWLLGRVMALTHCSPQAALQTGPCRGRIGASLASVSFLSPLLAPGQRSRCPLDRVRLCVSFQRLRLGAVAAVA